MNTSTATAILAAVLLSLALGYVAGNNKGHNKGYNKGSAIRARTLKNAEAKGWEEGRMYQLRITARNQPRNQRGEFAMRSKEI